MCWNETTDMLASMQDGKFVVWCYPAVIHFDKDLLPLTKLTKEGRWVGETFGPTGDFFLGRWGVEWRYVSLPTSFDGHKLEV